jgi:hypothetical protein
VTRNRIDPAQASGDAAVVITGEAATRGLAGGDVRKRHSQDLRTPVIGRGETTIPIIGDATGQYPIPIAATTVDFPRVFLYFPTNGAGSPILTAPETFDATVLDDLAKFDFMTINISPFTNTESPGNINVVSQLRARNPLTTILWYAQMSRMGQNLVHTSQWGEAWDLVLAAPDKRTVYNGSGIYYPFSNPLDGLPDLTAAGVAQAYADIWTKYGERGGHGYFFDTLISNTTKWDVNNGGMNYAVRGYGSAAAFDTASTAAHSTTVSRIGLTGKPMYLNRGSASDYYTPESIGLLCTGEFCELWFAGDQPPNFVCSHFGSIDNFMAFAQAHNRDGGAPGTSDGTMLLYTETGGLTQGDSSYRQMARFGLGCACLCGGRAGFGNVRNAADRFLRADEWAVNSSGATDTTMSHPNKSWLGRPVEQGFKSGNVWVRRFTNGIVIVNGTLSSQNYTLPATYKRINGAYDTSLNNGATISGTVSVPSKDARFYLRA